MAPKNHANTVEHGSVNVPGKPTGDGDTMRQPSDSGATSTKVQEPPAEAASMEGEDAVKGAAFTAPGTPLAKESSHMPGSDSTPHL
jgi:hypothetical protein